MSSRGRSSKRQRVFGAPTEEDLPSAQQTYNVFSDAISTRDVLSSLHPPTLATLCARVFVNNIERLSSSETNWELARAWLKIIPDILLQKLFAMLRTSCPARLSHGFIIANFLRGTSVTLTSDLPGVNRYTIEGVARGGQTLRELRLTGFEKFSDIVYASVLQNLPSLQVLVLRSCSKVAAKTVEAAAKYCPLLTAVNFGYTAVTPSSVASLVQKCRELEVLKLAGVQSWTDATFAKFVSALQQQLPKLRTLKLRQTALSDASISPLLSLCPNLESLDVSFTLIRSFQKHHDINIGSKMPPLRKLNLTSTSISGADLLVMLPSLTLLKTLSLGALGSRQGSTLSITNTSAMTLTEDMLEHLTDILSHFKDLENINLVGNTKLCLTTSHALPRFVRLVGRKCKKLNMAGIPSLRSKDLEGLLPTDSDPNPSSLTTLILNNTGIDDDSVPFISSCPYLQSLEIAGTKLTSEPVFSIIDVCPKLEKLDLTSCRGIRVVDRRRFFEVWKEDRNG